MQAFAQDMLTNFQASVLNGGMLGAALSVAVLCGGAAWGMRFMRHLRP